MSQTTNTQTMDKQAMQLTDDEQFAIRFLKVSGGIIGNQEINGYVVYPQPYITLALLKGLKDKGYIDCCGDNYILTASAFEA